jgi:hypothetical protein
VANAQRTPIYRLLHGAPKLAGVPAHYVLILLGVGTVFGLGSMNISKVTGLVVISFVVISWFGLAFVYGQDRTRVPLLALRFLYRFPQRFDSFSPSNVRIRFEEKR